MPVVIVMPMSLVIMSFELHDVKHMSCATTATRSDTPAQPATALVEVAAESRGDEQVRAGRHGEHGDS